jgi:multicomponent Na+:H+ antiporter subunit F
MNVDLAGAHWVLPLTLGILALSVALVCARFVSGPKRSDRIVAVDALGLIGVGVLALLAAQHQERVLLDVAALLALMSFAGTAAFALLMAKKPYQAPSRHTLASPPPPSTVPNTATPPATPHSEAPTP